MQTAVHKCVAEPKVGNDMATHTIDLRAFKVPVTKFVKSEVNKHSLVKVEMDSYRNVSSKVVVGQNKMAEDIFMPQKTD